jgi:hypothetical protein
MIRTNIRTVRATVGQGALAKCLLPFAVPILLTFGLLALIGDRWPRDLAPGSGLKLAGLFTTVITACAVWHHAVGRVEDRDARRFLAAVCALTGLLGWPVWSVGVLPSINGAVQRNPVTVRMALERTEVTHASKSRNRYHWAWFRADGGTHARLSGRYFISEELYESLGHASSAQVDVTFAEGLLGAQMVLGFDSLRDRSPEGVGSRRVGGS